MRILESKTKAALACVAVALALAGCGGGSESEPGDADGSAAGGSEDGSAQSTPPVADSGSQGTPTVGFDAAALGTEPLDSVHFRIGQGGGSEAPSVSPVVDTCAALAAAELDVIANAAAEQYSLGEQHAFVAEPAGAACRYKSDTHSILVVVGSADEVGVDSASILFPVFAGDVSETPWADDSSVTILSEDSFGVDTPFAALVTAGSYGVAVSNGGGTGIDYSSEGILFAEVATAVAAGTDGAPAPADGAESGATSGDPCTAWTVEEVDAFFSDASIDGDDIVTVREGCVWSAENGGAEVAISLLDPADAAAYVLVPAAPGGAALQEEPWGGRAYVLVDDAFAYVTVTVIDPETLNYLDTRDAAVALAENLVVRIGA